MTGITHRLGGISAGVALVDVLQITDVKAQAVLIGGCIVGSLLPDIDNPKSMISFKLPMVRMIIGALQGLIRLLSNILPRKQREYVRSCIGHRGLIHSLSAALLLAAVIVLAGKAAGCSSMLLAFGIMIGMFSHVILDLFSGGAWLFLPFTDRNIKIMDIKTGGIVEMVFRALLAAIILYELLNYIDNHNLFFHMLNWWLDTCKPTQQYITLEQEILNNIW